MANVVSYQQPYPRIYLIDIVLDLSPTQYEVVTVARNNRTHNCGSCGRQNPVRTTKAKPLESSAKEEDGREVRYSIENIILMDSFTIEIHDKRFDPFQTISYVAGKESIECRPLGCNLNGVSWRPEEIELLVIDLVDSENKENVSTSEVISTTTSPLIKKGKYPYLSQEFINQWIKRCTRPTGIVDGNQLHSQLRAANKRAQEAAEQVPEETLAIQQAREIIENS